MWLVGCKVFHGVGDMIHWREFMNVEINFRFLKTRQIVIT